MRCSPRFRGIDHEDDLAGIPLLRYPRWIDDVPSEISELMDQGFDTVVRLPFDQRFADRLGLDESEWIATIRSALEGISDQIILLLGTFDEVLVQDRLAEHHGPDPAAVGGQNHI